MECESPQSLGYRNAASEHLPIFLPLYRHQFFRPLYKRAYSRLIIPYHTIKWSEVGTVADIPDLTQVVSARISLCRAKECEIRELTKK